MDNKLNEIRKALESATQGKWQADDQDTAYSAEVFVYQDYIHTSIAGGMRTEDAHLIANAPEWLSYLLTELDAQGKELERVERLAEQWAKAYDGIRAELRRELDAAKKESEFYKSNYTHLYNSHNELSQQEEEYNVKCQELQYQLDAANEWRQDKERIQEVTDNWYRDHVKKVKHLFPLENTPGIGKITDALLEAKAELDAAKRQLSELCPIADFDVITSLQAEKAHMQDEIAELRLDLDTAKQENERLQNQRNFTIRANNNTVRVNDELRKQLKQAIEALEWIAETTGDQQMRLVGCPSMARKALSLIREGESQE